MKKLLTLFPISVALVLFSCQKNKKQPPPAVAADYVKAVTMLERQPDSAFYYFNEVVSTSKDSLQIAKAYCNMGRIQSDAGDHYGAQESLTQSLKYLNEAEPQDYRCLASDYNELGITSTNLKQYNQALNYLNRSIHFANDSSFLISILSNKANVYRKKKQYSLALQFYREIAHATPPKGRSYAWLLTNMASTQWRDNPLYNPVGQLQKALQIRIKTKDVAGTNSSYAHLTDYYMSDRIDSAFFYAKKWYTIAKKIRSPEDELDALSSLIKLSPRNTNRYFAIYKHINDSLQTARNATKNQFALIRYEVQKNKADNLKLQRDNAEKGYQLSRQRFISLGISILLLGVSLIGWLWLKKRQERMRLEKEKAVQEREYNILKRVHDVVANGLYRLMKSVQNKDQLVRAALVNDLDQLYERSRTLSYDGLSSSTDRFQEEVSKLIRSFADEKRRITIAGNEDELWRLTDSALQMVVLDTILELMVNMDKHSQAKQVAVRFQHEHNQLLITYTDDGIGLPKNVKFGNGLISTGNRIQQANGYITFDKRTTGGLQVLLSLPLP